MEATKKATQSSEEQSSIKTRLRTIAEAIGKTLWDSARRLVHFMWEGLWDGVVSITSLILVVFSNFLLFEFEEWIITVYVLLFTGLFIRLIIPKQPWGYILIILGGFLDYILSLTVFHWVILLLDTILVGSTITNLYGTYEEASKEYEKQNNKTA